MLTTLVFWESALERAVKTFAQTLAALIGAGAISVVSIPWQDNLGISATAALLSVLTSIASAQVGPSGPSLTVETVTPQPPQGTTLTVTPPPVVVLTQPPVVVVTPPLPPAA